MQNFKAGNDLTIIAVRLGHESNATNRGYVEADHAMKERALEAIAPLEAKCKLLR
jgi:hypothetical protein